LRAAAAYCRRVPDLWFVAGLAIGIVLTGFCAIGSFDRGADSVRRGTWALELAARQRAVVASQSDRRAPLARPVVRHDVSEEPDRLRPAMSRRVDTVAPDQERGLALRADVG
jgi:hypothetical protein